MLQNNSLPGPRGIQALNVALLPGGKYTQVTTAKTRESRLVAAVQEVSWIACMDASKDTGALSMHGVRMHSNISMVGASPELPMHYIM